MKRSRVLFAVMALLVPGAACSNDPAGAGAESGNLYLRLDTPNADDGALLFEVTGAPIDGAVAGNGSLRLFTWRKDESTLVGAVLGTVTAGAVVSLRVPDISAATAYSARLIEVADRQDALRPSLTGYALAVGP